MTPTSYSPLDVISEYLSGNNQPHGLMRHLETLDTYVAQPYNNWLWAYNGNRVSREDFYLHHSNSYPWGIFLEYTSGQTYDVLRVLDGSSKMFRYKFPLARDE